MKIAAQNQVNWNSVCVQTRNNQIFSQHCRLNIFLVTCGFFFYEAYTQYMYMFKLIFIKLLIFNDKTLRIITKLKFDIKIYPACRCKNDLCTRDLTCWYLAPRENFKTTAVCLFIPTCSHEITILGTLMRSILLHPNYQTCLEKKLMTRVQMVTPGKFDPEGCESCCVVRICLKFNTVQYLYAVILCWL